MAGDNLTNLSPALGTTFATILTRAWNRASVVLSGLTVRPGGGLGGGKQLGWDVQFSGADAASFAEGADVAAGELTHDTEVAATLPWGQYRSAFQLTDLEMNAAAANVGNAKELENILEERMSGAITKITSKMNGDVISGTGTDGSGNPTLVGLVTALAATGTYANLSKATHAEWAGNVSANGGIARPLTLDLLAKAEQLSYTASGMSPEALIVTPGIKTKYEGLFNAQQRVNAGANGPIARFDASSEDLFWRGRPIVRDKDMPAGTVIGPVLSAIALHVLPWAPVPDGTPQTMRQLISSAGDPATQQMLGAMVRVVPLARVGSAVRFMASIYCQLKVARTNEHFLLQDVSES